jgi:gliding motility-associated-like protein
MKIVSARFLSIILFLLGISALALGLRVQHSPVVDATSPQATEAVCEGHSHHAGKGDKLFFEQNKGQFHPNALYRAELHQAKLFVEKDGLTWLLTNANDLQAIHTCKHTAGCNMRHIVLHQHALRMKFLGSNGINTQVVGKDKMATYRNYFRGNDPTKWVSNAPLFAELQYQQLYNGIDLRLYSTETALKYDIIVHPQGNANQIEWQYEGATLHIDTEGNLHIANTVNELIEKAPFAYQIIAGKTVNVACNFVLSNGKVSLQFAQNYDRRYDLIIDPALVFSSYTGSLADNWGMTATPSNDGSFFLGGATFDFGYPTTTGAFDSSFGGGSGSITDITISKFAADGSDLLYSTYLGGSRTELPHSLIANEAGELFILGTTSSNNYPITTGCFDSSYNGGNSINVSGIDYENGSDIVVTKMAANGQSLIGSTYMGGSANDGLNTGLLKFNYADEARGEIMLDGQGNVYIASCTRSNNFPMVNAFQPSIGGSQDACIVKLNPDLSTVIWSSYLGGDNEDAAYSIKIDPANGEALIGGGTRSSDLLTGIAGFDNSYNGGTADGYMVRINANGSAVISGTFLGTSDYDQVYFVEFDQDDRAYAFGQTSGSYAVSSGVFNNANSGQFIHALSNDLLNSEFSTVFGRGDGDPDIAPSAFLVDICNRIYISGWGGEVNAEATGNSTTDGLPTTGDAFQSFTDGSDFYFMLLNEDAETLEYATFFGASGGGPEHVDGGTSRFDKQGIIYQAVCAGCGGFSSFPTTSGAWSQTNNSLNCNAGSIKFAFEPPYTIAAVAILPGAVGCAPFTVFFDDVSFNASSLQWSLDGVAVSNGTTFTHTFTETGTYTIQLIASNAETCNIADTTVSVIQVIDPLTFNAGFTPNIDCVNFNVSFVPDEMQGDHFWTFGNGQVSIEATPSVHYAAQGTYTVTHIITSNVPNCPATDTVTQQIIIAPAVTAQFSASDTLGCIPLTVQFNNSSINATEGYVWDFGNGQSSTDPNPSVTFTNEGTYMVSLTAANPESCNGTNTFVMAVTALDTIITADFSYILPQLCDPQTVQFSTPLNPMLDFTWQFGDGSTAGDLPNPTHTYTASGTYTATLIADSPCAEPDTAQYSFDLLPQPIVNGNIINAPQSACPPVVVSLQAQGNALTYTWLMGDGTQLSGTTADYVYTEPGNYTIQLIAADPNTCNLADTSQVTLSVYQYAEALFTMSTDIIELNDTVFFNNQSSNADSYLWNFGDGTSDTLTNPQHQFVQLGELQVCLQAINNQQCNDEYCLPMQVIPVINIGVPTAFSPNDDQLNDILYVEGRNNIQLMNLKIYNRWGELVFETNDPQSGWDGTYKNTPQDMDAFAYTLIADLVSGRRVTAQGNITLIR